MSSAKSISWLKYTDSSFFKSLYKKNFHWSIDHKKLLPQDTLREWICYTQNIILSHQDDLGHIVTGPHDPLITVPIPVTLDGGEAVCAFEKKKWFTI